MGQQARQHTSGHHSDQISRSALRDGATNNSSMDVAVIINQVLWYNSKIRFKGKPFIWNNWVERGLIYVKDLYDNQGNPRTAAELGVNWLEFKTLIRCIPREWFEIIEGVDFTTVTDRPTLYDKMNINAKNAVKNAYNSLIFDKDNMYKYLTRWLDELSVDPELFQESFERTRCCTKVSKYRDFQYRLNLGKIIVNDDLFKWRKIDSNLCSLCRSHIETKTHLFYECDKVQPIIQSVYTKCTENEIEIDTSKKAFIFNHVVDNKYHVVNFLSIMLKQLINKYRCLKKPYKVTCETFWCEVDLQLQIELAIAKDENNVSKLHKRWSPITDVNILNTT